MTRKNINCVGQLLKSDGKPKVDNVTRRTPEGEY